MFKQITFNLPVLVYAPSRLGVDKSPLPVNEYGRDVLVGIVWYAAVSDDRHKLRARISLGQCSNVLKCLVARQNAVTISDKEARTTVQFTRSCTGNTRRPYPCLSCAHRPGLRRPCLPLSPLSYTDLLKYQ